MIDVWHTLDAILPDISKQLRDATKDHPEHPIQAVDGWQYLMNFLILEDTPINGKIATENWQRWSYVSIEAMDKAFQQLAEQGYAEQSGDTFTIAEKGCDAYLDYFGQREEAFAKIVVLSEADFVTFINFFKKGYEAAKLADNPPICPAIIMGISFMAISLVDNWVQCSDGLICLKFTVMIHMYGFGNRLDLRAFKSRV